MQAGERKLLAPQMHSISITLRVLCWSLISTHGRSTDGELWQHRKGCREKKEKDGFQKNTMEVMYTKEDYQNSVAAGEMNLSVRYHQYASSKYWYFTTMASYTDFQVTLPALLHCGSSRWHTAGEFKQKLNSWQGEMALCNVEKRSSWEEARHICVWNLDKVQFCPMTLIP